MSTHRSTAEPASLFTPVAEWRRERLMAAGFAEDVAFQLAEGCAIDCTPRWTSSVGAARPRWPRAFLRP